VEDGVAVVALQRGEEGRGVRVGVELALEILRHGGLALGVIGGLPAAVPLGALDLRVPRRLHATVLDERRRLLAIDLRPLAPRAAWGEFLQPEFRVESPLLAVDPAIAEGHLQ